MARGGGECSTKWISEFDGSASVAEYVEAQLTRDICGVKQVELVFPFRLTGGTLAIYRQLSQKETSIVKSIKDDRFT